MREIATELHGWLMPKTFKKVGPYFIKACGDAGAGLENAKEPYENGQNYLEVLKYEKRA